MGIQNWIHPQESSKISLYRNCRESHREQKVKGNTSQARKRNEQGFYSSVKIKFQEFPGVICFFPGVPYWTELVYKGLKSVYIYRLTTKFLSSMIIANSTCLKQFGMKCSSENQNCRSIQGVFLDLSTFFEDRLKRCKHLKNYVYLSI